MNPKSISVESGQKLTNGQVRRTLRGMDGRISHVEMLASRWETRKIEETVEKAVEVAVSLFMKQVEAEIAALKDRIKALEPTEAAPTA